MNLAVEKDEIIRRIGQETDEYVIQPKKDLLDHPRRCATYFG